jgi:diguanylate cyclase (GGDEF)-like protein/PAS domain S-box-containing protein
LIFIGRDYDIGDRRPFDNPVSRLSGCSIPEKTAKFISSSRRLRGGREYRAQAHDLRLMGSAMPGTDYSNLSRAQLLEVIRELKGILSERRSQPFARPEAFGPSKLESALSEQEARRGAWQRVVPHPQLLAAIVEASADAITSRTLDGTLLTWNKGAEKVYGYAAGEAIGRNYLMLFPESSEAEVADLNARLLRGESIFDMESVRKRKDGSLVHVSINVAPLFEKGRVVRICSIARDITARKDAEQQIRRMAHFDPLTGLPNRILLIDRLEQALAVSQRNHSRTGVMFLDLDHFKDVNDRLGHHIGDQLLQQVAGRVQDSLREVDTVSRVGGDEFILVLPELRQPDDAATIARKMLSLIAGEYIVGGVKLLITSSLGVSIYPDHGRDPGLLIRLADKAMYDAKQAGRNGYRLYPQKTN